MMRKILAAATLAAGTALLAGCADYPYNDTYYGSYGYNSYPSTYYSHNGYWYGPGYYAAPSVGFGITYSNRPYYYRGRWYG
jgi:hypothetical protein